MEFLNKIVDFFFVGIKFRKKGMDRLIDG